MTASAPVPAGLPRRLAAIVYDGLLLLGLWMITGALWLPFTDNGSLPTSGPVHILFQLSLAAVACVFFATFWRKGGQTLGMRAWRLRLESADGGPLTLRQIGIRLAVATLSWLALGLGFLWSLFEPRRRAWHDLASGTRLVVLPKR